MSLFTLKEREAAKEYLVAHANKNADIISCILLGSASYGYIDELSDVDFCVVINQEDNIEKVMFYMSEGVKAYNPLLCFEQLTQRRLQVYLLDNYLELNVSFQSVGSIHIKKSNWKVVLDKSGEVETEAIKSWTAYQETQNEKTLHKDVDEKVKSYANETWHFLFHCAIAIKRKKYWRTIGELDILRNRLIELKGLRYSISTGRYREVDDLPKDELEIIQKIMVTDSSWEALVRCLDLLTDAIYDEFDAQGVREFYSVNRQQVKEYIRDVFAMKSMG